MRLVDTRIFERETQNAAQRPVVVEDDRRHWTGDVRSGRSPLEAVPPGSRGWTSVVSITGPDRIKMSATGPNVFGRAKVRGFWRWDGEGSALWSDAPTDPMHAPRMHVVYNQSFEARTAMACSDRMLEVEGDYQIIPMVGEATLVPDRVRIVPQ